jgi:hypothetical protein
MKMAPAMPMLSPATLMNVKSGLFLQRAERGPDVYIKHTNKFRVLYMGI